VLTGDCPADRLGHHAFKPGNVGGDEHARAAVLVAQRHSLSQQRCQGTLGISLAAETAHLDLPQGRRDVCFGITHRRRPFARLAPTRDRAQQTHKHY